MTTPVSLTQRPVATATVLVTAMLVLLAALAIVLWSVLGAEPELLGPTRWLEVWRTFA